MFGLGDNPETPDAGSGPSVGNRRFLLVSNDGSRILGEVELDGMEIPVGLGLKNPWVQPQFVGEVDGEIYAFGYVHLGPRITDPLALYYAPTGL